MWRDPVTRSTRSNENTEKSPKPVGPIPKDGLAESLTLSREKAGSERRYPRVMRAQERSLTLRLAPYAFLAAVWLALLPVLDIGWSAVDDGALSHAADRINQGDLPHRDFYDPYTGGLSLLNSVVLRTLGYDLLSLRYPLWVLLGLWMFALFGLARRLLSPAEASLAVGGLAAVSFLMHMTPMPSWYNLMLGTLALLCTIKFAETSGRFWLVLAGLAIGVSFLAKSAGLFLGLAVGFVLCARAVRSGIQHQVLIARGLMVLGALSVGVLLSTSMSLNRQFFFLLPICLFIASEWKPRPHSVGNGPVALEAELGLVSLGMAVPIGLFAVYFWQNEALSHLFSSLTRTPGIILQVSADAPDMAQVLLPALFGVVVWRVSLGTGREQVYVGMCVTGVVVAGYMIEPWTVLLAGLWLAEWTCFYTGVLYFAHSTRRMAMPPLAVVVVVAGAVGFALIGFPAFNEYYAFYMLPLGGIGVVVVTKLMSWRACRPLLAGMAMFLAVFAFAKLEGRWMTLAPSDEEIGYVSLEGERGGIRIPKYFDFYNEMIHQVQENAATGEMFIAGPDSPEIYFLTGLRNETPILFDGLATGLGSEVNTLSVLESGRAGLFVRNNAPIMSSRIEMNDFMGDSVLISQFPRFDLYRLSEKG